MASATWSHTQPATMCQQWHSYVVAVTHRETVCWQFLLGLLHTQMPEGCNCWLIFCCFATEVAAVAGLHLLVVAWAKASRCMCWARSGTYINGTVAQFYSRHLLSVSVGPSCCNGRAPSHCGDSWEQIYASEVSLRPLSWGPLGLWYGGVWDYICMMVAVPDHTSATLLPI